MKSTGKLSFKGVNKYRFKTILFIAFLWTFCDTIVVLVFNSLPVQPGHNKLSPLLIREIIVFLMSLAMGYLLVFTLKKLFRNYSLWAAYLIKSSILVVAAFSMQLLLYAVNTISLFGTPLTSAFHRFYEQMFDLNWVIQKICYWLILFIITQLIIEINEKYSPGVFIDILFGKYIQPKIEKRIIMFIDLKDSTGIAEKLESKENFSFIREFIYHISIALIEYGGIIYQYVGDEIVVSWLHSPRNTKRCIMAVIEARKNLNRNSHHFKRRYGIVPEYRMGVHIGEVTVGEIGVIKKDLAMSGDAMNTAARIKAACSELDQNFIASKDFVEQTNMKDWQMESLGPAALKGKETELELFALRNK